MATEATSTQKTSARAFASARLSCAFYPWLCEKEKELGLVENFVPTFERCLFYRGGCMVLHARLHEFPKAEVWMWAPSESWSSCFRAALRHLLPHVRQRCARCTLRKAGLGGRGCATGQTVRKADPAVLMISSTASVMSTVRWVVGNMHGTCS